MTRTDDDRRTPPRSVFAMREGLPVELFGQDGLDRLARVADTGGARVLRDFDDPDAGLDDIEVLITGWGCPPVTEDVLDRLPRLRAIVHTAGTVKDHLASDPWSRGIRVTSAAAANAIPVAEYTLAMILLAGKDAMELSRRYAADPGVHAHLPLDHIGNFGRTVGVIGASRIGRRVIDLLAPFDFDVLLYDPHVAADDPVAARARLVGLDELFDRSTIVTVHAPLLPETVGMVGRAQLQRLAPGSTVINTARGPIVDQRALEEAVRQRGLRAVLDVTSPEPLPAADPLRRLPGVTLTPHIAGALGNELRRLGASALREVELYAAGLPAAFPVHKETLAATA